MTAPPLLRRNPARKARARSHQFQLEAIHNGSKEVAQNSAPTGTGMLKSVTPRQSRKRARVLESKLPSSAFTSPSGSDVSSPLADTETVPVHKVTLHQFQDKSDIKAIQTALIMWYHKYQRQMPWRIPYDPTSCFDDYPIPPAQLGQRAYEVWVSEVMLQQTQVKTVEAYYRCWLQAFPTLADLAAAPMERVNEIWAGLGYYSRARRLQEGAALVLEKFHGILPQSAKKLQTQVPGIGPYTAGAIASIAYRQAEPLVDGNVVRVLSRLLAFGGDVSKASAVHWTWETARVLLLESDPGHWNQALMELGATVCTPKNPNCEACPVAKWCRAREQQEDSNSFRDRISCLAQQPDVETCHVCLPVDPAVLDVPTVTMYPRKGKKKPPRQEATCVFIIELLTEPSPTFSTTTTRGKYLFIQRPPQGLLANLWEPLTFPIPASDTPNVKDCSPEASQPWQKVVSDLVPHLLIQMVPHHQVELSLQLSDCVFVGTVVHLFSHIHMAYHVHYWPLVASPSLVEAVSSADFQPTAEINDVAKPVAGQPCFSDLMNSRTYRWVTENSLKSLPLSTGMKKAFKLVDTWKASSNGHGTP
ncbi:hypothetical protein IWQ62_000664 [Dispira parvispora]|uniref:Adenine DNA glycosylase n=1 Tax=Dispira parvispora TaxID=1520584 RepID=A0A9W8AVF3_9FUNG|nr:hypothetical protein IWQ62_000664 [Dispira parvispora]